MRTSTYTRLSLHPASATAVVAGIAAAALLVGVGARGRNGR
jgi:hypothetical protein